LFIMTADEAKALAGAFLSRVHDTPCAVFDWSTRETRTHWRFYWNTVAAMEGREGALKGVDPVAVDKRTGAAALDRKRAPGEACNVAFPLPATGPVANEAAAAALLQAWLDATKETACFVRLHRELPAGWVFIWNTEASVDDPLAGYVGQGPTIVVRATGQIFDMGSAPGYEERLAELVRELSALGLVIDD
jgi:hypothetical protein